MAVTVKPQYERTKEQGVIITDFDFKAINSCGLPTITDDNIAEQEDGCVGIYEGDPVYFKGGEMLPFGTGPELIRIDLDFADLTGSITIDYTTLSANIPEPILEFWNTEEITEGVIKETNINDVKIVKTRTEGVITEIFLDGIFGTGFIRVLPAPTTVPA